MSSEGRPTSYEVHSRKNAARMLADSNYPTDYEWDDLVHRQQDVYDRKMVVNLRAMLEEARTRDS